MSLTVALTTARSSLQATGVQTSVSSRNVAGANDTSFSRKNAVLAPLPGGGVYVTSIQRAADNGLFNQLTTATSNSAKQNVLYNAINALSASTVDDPQNDHSPAAMLSNLTNALQQYATAPDDLTLAQALVTSANDMAQSLNQATADTQNAREQADEDMATSVAHINDLLQQFEGLNTTIIKGTIAGADVTDYQDQRDQVISQLSQEIGIVVVPRANGDEAIYTDSGVTLFETKARSVTFTPTQAFDATITGNAVYVDGVPVTGAGAVMPIKSGNLAGYSEMRDNIAVTYQSQLDEIARGLIEVFSETDQSAIPTQPQVPGLFTYAGAPAMPTTGVINPGLAGTIKVNPAVDPDQGGDPTLVRDGAINGNPAYTYNTTGAAGFFARLQDLGNQLAANRTFDPATMAKSTGTLLDFAGSSASWIEAQRSTTNANATYQTALVQRSAEALSNATGVNLNDEMIVMQQIERTFAASSKLIATVDQMLQSLLSAVG